MHIILASFFYILTSQWIDSGWRFCKYSNGEVTRVHIADLCPINIQR